METQRLKQFCTVVQTGNLRKAATLLGISHSGLFKSMKVLEQELGFPLFLPSGRGIVVSDQGSRLYERTDAFFRELNHLMGTDASKDINLVRIGSFEVFTSFFIGELLKELQGEFEVEIHELVPGKLEEALFLNKVDIGITYEPIPRKGIEYVKVASVQMGIYVRKNAFRDKEALAIPFVVPVNPLEGAPSGVKGRDAWPDERFERNIRYRVDLMVTGLELVRQGLCGIFIPDFVAQFHNERSAAGLRLESVALPKGMGSVQRDVFLVKRESTVENPQIQKVAKALRLLK